MNPEVRRAAAFIAGRAKTDKAATSIYDYSTSGYFNFSGEVSETRVAVYDFAAGCHISGTRSGEQISLYHFGVGSHLNIRLQQNDRFSGYDFSSSSHFSGSVSQNH